MNFEKGLLTLILIMCIICSVLHKKYSTLHFFARRNNVKRIAIIEDEPMMREELAQIMRRNRLGLLTEKERENRKSSSFMKN